jgi:hypothetical protein
MVELIDLIEDFSPQPQKNPVSRAGFVDPHYCMNSSCRLLEERLGVVAMEDTACPPEEQHHEKFPHDNARLPEEKGDAAAMESSHRCPEEYDVQHTSFLDEEFPVDPLELALTQDIDALWQKSDHSCNVSLQDDGHFQACTDRCPQDDFQTPVLERNWCCGHSQERWRCWQGGVREQCLAEGCNQSSSSSSTVNARVSEVCWSQDTELESEASTQPEDNMQALTQPEAITQALTQPEANTQASQERLLHDRDMLGRRYARYQMSKLSGGRAKEARYDYRPGCKGDLESMTTGMTTDALRQEVLFALQGIPDEMWHNTARPNVRPPGESTSLQLCLGLITSASWRGIPMPSANTWLPYPKGRRCGNHWRNSNQMQRNAGLHI